MGNKDKQWTLGYTSSPWGVVGLADWGGKLCALEFVENIGDPFGISYGSLAAMALRQDLAKFWCDPKTEQGLSGTSFVRKDLWAGEIMKAFLEENLRDQPFLLYGTPFEMKVWSALQTIPFGRQITYGQLAERIGFPKAYRAVGTAVGKNPISLLIPCHRVVKQGGAGGSYRWGFERKEQILMWEKKLQREKI